MPVTLNVSQIRRELYRAAGGPCGAGPGEPSTPLLGQWFHEVFTALTGPDERMNWRTVVVQAAPDRAAWRLRLIEHAYRSLVGPRLADRQADLQPFAAEALGFWQAVEALCGWLVDRGWTLGAAAERPGPVGVEFAGHGRELAVELREPGWTDTVRVVGAIDALLRRPGAAEWAVAELKLGRTAPEADLAQGCLYHWMLRQSGTAVERLVLLGFEPELRERSFDAAELAEAQDRLHALIGRLAGVLPDSRGGTAAEPAEIAPDWQADETEKRELADLGRKLVAALDEFRLPVVLDGEPIIGPAVARFHATPGRGVRPTAVIKRAYDVWPRLGTAQPPLIALDHGRLALDVQRPRRRIVSWDSIRRGLPRAEDPRRGVSRFPVGVDLGGAIVWADLATPAHCHILVAGSTGSGKTEFLRAAVASLVAVNPPDALGLVLIDPKHTRFAAFAELPHLTRPVVHPGGDDMLKVLDELIAEMEGRYDRIRAAGVHDRDAFVLRTGERMPRLVCVCDEYMDLVLHDRRARAGFEARVSRLGAKGREAGIHLILATQQPNRQVVTPLIRVNLVAKVVFRLELVESRVVLNDPMASLLLGQGDLWFYDMGAPQRLQAPLLGAELPG